MAAQEPAVEVRDLGGRHGDAFPGRDSGRHSVHRLPALHHIVHDGARRAHLLDRVPGEHDLVSLPCHPNDLLEREVVPGEEDAHGPASGP